MLVCSHWLASGARLDLPKSVALAEGLKAKRIWSARFDVLLPLQASAFASRSSACLHEAGSPFLMAVTVEQTPVITFARIEERLDRHGAKQLGPDLADATNGAVHTGGSQPPPYELRMQNGRHILSRGLSISRSCRIGRTRRCRGDCRSGFIQVNAYP